MGLSLSRGALLSRSVRRSVAGLFLTRKLNLKTSVSLANNTGASGGGGAIQQFLGGLMPWASKFVGFVTAKLFSFAGWGFVQFFSLLNDIRVGFINFDWRASDREIQAIIDARNNVLAGQWGGVLGSAAGWIVGIAVGSGFTIACPVIGSGKLASVAAGNAALEGIEDVGTRLATTIVETGKIFLADRIISAYRYGRRALGFNPPDEAPRSTISGFFSSKTESIKSEGFRNFLENFGDEFWDGFIEAGYIFAYELDAQLAASRTANAGGINRTVKLTPDVDAPGEAIVLTGGQDVLKNTIQTTLAQHRLIHNRDVGMIVGLPADDALRATPHRRKMTIVFNEIEVPPFVRRDKKQPTRAVLTIPDPKVGLSWNRIKQAAKPYVWGPFRCTAHLTNGRQMAVYGGTPQEAEEKLRELLELSTCEISTLAITQEKQRSPRLRKDAKRLYPHSASLLVRRDSIDPDRGRALNSGVVAEKIYRFELWTKNEPRSFKQILW